MMNSIFPNNLKKLRKKFGFSQEDFAEIIGYSAKNVSKWETGQSVPSIDVLNDICGIFKLANISELVNDIIDYYDFDVDEDYAYIQKHQLSISKETVCFYYDLIKSSGLYRTSIDEKVYEYLSELQNNEIISEYTINQTDEEMYIHYSINFESDDLTLRNYFMKKSHDQVNFANDTEYEEYVSNLKLPKQVMIVLSFIDDYHEEQFTLSDLYNDKLIAVLAENYGPNKDHKKIIRTCLAKISDSGIITKVGYATYSKKHHKIKNYVELDDALIRKIDSILKLQFEGLSFDRSFKISEFKLLNKSSSELQIILNNYMIYLRNLSLVTDFEILIENDYINIRYCVD